MSICKARPATNYNIGLVFSNILLEFQFNFGHTRLLCDSRSVTSVSVTSGGETPLKIFSRPWKNVLDIV